MATINVDLKSGTSTQTESAISTPKSSKAQEKTLQLGRDFTAELQKQSKLLEKIIKLQESQRDVTSEIQDTIEDIDFEQLSQEASGFTNTTNKLSKSMKALSKASDESIGKIYLESQKADKTLKSMASTGGAIALVALAFKAVGNAISGVANIAQSALGFITGIVSSVFEIGKAIIAIPFRVFEGFVGLSNDVASVIMQIEVAVENVRKAFGDLRGPVSKSVLDVSRTMKGFATTGLSVWGVLGNVAETLDYVRELASTLGPVFSKLAVEFQTNGGALIAFQKGLGLTNEELRSVGDIAIITGKRARTVLINMTTQAIALGKAFGVDSKIISRDVGKALQDVAHFGGATIKQISVAAVYSRKLGVELDRIVGTLSAFETFDSAAENSAKLSQSFGILVDAFQLMEAQSPDQQIDMLRKSLFAAGRTAEGMTRQELKLLSQTTGLDEATAKVVFSMKNQGTTLDLLTKKSDIAEKKQLTQTEALVKLSASIERIVRQTPEFTGFFDAMLKGFSRGVLTSGPFTRSVFNLRNALVSVWREGAKLGKSFVNLFPGVYDALSGIADAFKPEKFQKFAAQFRHAFEDFFRGLTKGNYSFTDLMQNIRKSFFDFLSAETPAGKKMIGGIKTFLLTISQVIGQGLTWAIGALEKGIQFIVDLISNPTEVFSKMQAGAKSGTSFTQAFFAPIIQSLTDKKSIGGLTGALDDLFDILQLKIGRRVEQMALSLKQGIERSAALAIYETKANFIGRLLAGKDKVVDGRVVKGYEAKVDQDLLDEKQKHDAALASKYDNLEKAFIEKRKKIEAQNATQLIAAQKDNAIKASKDAMMTPTTTGEIQAASIAKQREIDIANLAEKFGSGLKTDVDPTIRVHKLSNAVDELITLKERVRKVDAATFKDLATKMIDMDTALKPVSDSLPQRLAQVVYGLNKVSELKLTALNNMAKVIKTGVIASTAAGVTDMIRVVNELDSALGNVASNKINIATKLQQLATTLPGMGSAGQYTIKNKDVVITVNLQVSMKADEVEKVILQRKESVIRDRLNNVSYKGPIQPMDIPSVSTAPSPLPMSPRK